MRPIPIWKRAMFSAVVYGILVLGLQVTALHDWPAALALWAPLALLGALAAEDRA